MLIVDPSCVRLSCNMFPVVLPISVNYCQIVCDLGSCGAFLSSHHLVQPIEGQIVPSTKGDSSIAFAPPPAGREPKPQCIDVTSIESETIGT